MAQMITETAETDLSKDTAKSLGKINPALAFVRPEQLQPVQYYVHLYSVSKRRMPESDLAFLIENDFYKTISVRTCAADQRFVKIMDIPHPLQTVEMDPHNWPETVVRVSNGKRVAMGICNPDIVGESMDRLPTQVQLARNSLAEGCDYIKQGLFFTLAEEGSKDFDKALKAAETRRDNYYRALLDGLLGMSDLQIQGVLAGSKGIDLRTAAMHFGEEIPGLRSRTQKMDCPNCFEKIPVGAAFHKNELLGVMCVIDWKRAVEAGVKTMADVPESKLWAGAVPKKKA